MKQRHIVLVNGKPFIRKSELNYTHALISVGIRGVRVCHWFRSLRYEKRHHRVRIQAQEWCQTVPVGSIVEATPSSVYIKELGWQPGRSYVQGIYTQDDKLVAEVSRDYSQTNGWQTRIDNPDGTHQLISGLATHQELMTNFFGYIQPPNDIRVVGSL